VGKAGKFSIRTEFPFLYLETLDESFQPEFLNRQEKPMPREIHWTDAEEIGIQLQEKFPDLDPLTVRFTDLHKYVTELQGFADDPSKSNESRLEAIQMAWHEEYEDAKG
jgi:FeS assembly protein IscX